MLTMKVPVPVPPAVVADKDRGFAAFPTVCEVTVKVHAVVGTFVHGVVDPALNKEAVTPGPEMVMPLVSTPEVISKTVSVVAAI